MTECNVTDLVEQRMNRVLTQYRESPKLLFLLSQYLKLIAETGTRLCHLPEKFNIDDSEGDQLTLLGKRLGWPRQHCVCDVEPVFGFECDDDEISLRSVVGFGNRLERIDFGFCDESSGFNQPVISNWNGCLDAEYFNQDDCIESSNWDECSSGLSFVTLSDDEIYRRFLKVRIFQYLKYFDHESLEHCLRVLFGPTAKILYSGQKRVVIAPGRNLTETEISLLQLYPRVLPVALGVEVLFHFGETRVFGFGDGWGGLSEPVIVINEDYEKTGKIFGFDDHSDTPFIIGGFCEDWEPDGLQLKADQYDDISVETENDVLVTGPLTEDSSWMCRKGAPWMCEIDVKPYDC